LWWGELVLMISITMRVRMWFFFGSTIRAGIHCAVTSHGKLLLNGRAISMISMRRAVSVLVRAFLVAVVRFLFITAKNETRRYYQKKSELFHFVKYGKGTVWSIEIDAIRLLQTVTPVYSAWWVRMKQ
jgi:uncharacterized membrane protein YgaE (UPF0421/DUF939 family)